MASVSPSIVLAALMLLYSATHVGANNRSVALANDSSDREEPQYFSHRYRIIGTFFQTIVLVVGVAGNVMVVVVVCRTHSMLSPTNCYLVSLAVADCIVLVASVPNEILSYYLLGNQWIWGQAGCAGFIFCQNLAINASSLSLLAFTLERYIAICQPLRAHTLCTVSRAKRITLGVWLFAAIYSSPWLVLTTTRALKYRGHRDLDWCDFKFPRAQYLVYYCCDLVAFYVAPLLLSCVMYCLIARVLFTRRLVHTRSQQPNGTVHSDAAAAARSQVVKMLAVVVAVFATLWLPYRGLMVYNSFATLMSKEKYMDLWFLMFAKMCIYINSAINPILYNAMSGKFRRAFRKTLMCCLLPLPENGTGFVPDVTAALPASSSSHRSLSQSSTRVSRLWSKSRGSSQVSGNGDVAQATANGDRQEQTPLMTTTAEDQQPSTSTAQTQL